jgi:MoaA/NifB/PqqE/SkfB family radical SAM enzyme
MHTALEFPERVELELASVCNLRCSYCPRRYVDDLHGFMDPDLFYRLIDEISAHEQRIIVLHRRGESLLHPEFIPMLEYCAGKFREVQMATNATVMDPAKAEAMMAVLDFVSFSIDLPERMEKVRGADYGRVLANIEYFLARNQKTRTQVSMVRTDEVREADCERFVELWTGKVDRVRIYQEHSAGGRFGAVAAKRPQRRACVMPFYEMVVLCTGQTARCNHDWDGSAMGWADKQSLTEIWRSPAYEELRRQHNRLESSDAVCSGCDSWYPERGVQGTGRVVEQPEADRAAS